MPKTNSSSNEVYWSFKYMQMLFTDTFVTVIWGSMLSVTTGGY